MLKKTIAFLTVLLLLSSCSAAKIESETQGLSYISDCGIYYENNYIYLIPSITPGFPNKYVIFNVDSLKTVPLCFNPNCNHNGSCVSVMTGNSVPVIYNRNVYYFVCDYSVVQEKNSKEKTVVFNSALESISMDTNEKKTIAVVTDCMPPQNSGRFALFGNEMFFIGDDMNPMPDDYGSLRLSDAGGTHYLCSINLDNGKYTNYGSIYDDDKQYEYAAYSSSGQITGVYDGKIYVGYSFIKSEEDYKKDDKFTLINFAFDPKTKSLKESELPYSLYMNDSTYTYYNREDKCVHVLKDDRETILHTGQDIRFNCEYNNKLFADNLWYDLNDGTEHSIEKYRKYKLAGYKDGKYIFINGQRVAELTEEELLAVGSE